MTKKITSMTPKQAARMGGWAERWIEIGLSTEPADFDAATEAALRGYALANLDRPMVVLRMGSPYAATVGGAIAWAMLREMKGDQVRDQVWAQVGDQVRDQVWAQVGDQVGDQVRDQVRAQVWDQVRDQVRDQVWDQVRDQVRDQVWAQVGDQVRAQVWDQVGDQVRDATYNDYGGSLWAFWPAYITFFRDVLGWSDPTLEKFEPLETLSKTCGWVWWHENVLAISDRPEIINRDEQGRLHSEVGAAIRYRDGWGLHFWHGVRVPAEWIEDKDNLDPAEVLRRENVEQRAAGASIVGWPKMADKLDRLVIDGDPDTDIGALVELSLPGLNEPGRFLMAQCPRNGTICEGVPRISDIDNEPIETAIAAQAWRDGLPVNAYSHPTIRT